MPPRFTAHHVAVLAPLRAAGPPSASLRSPRGPHVASADDAASIFPSSTARRPPEAASISLFGSGLILIGLMRRRREEAPAKAAR